jgi:hypothetical protein
MLDRLAFNEIDITAKNISEFILHGNQIGEAPPGLLFKADQHVDVAVCVEITPQYRSQKRELYNNPFVAKCFDLILKPVDIEFTHGMLQELDFLGVIILLGWQKGQTQVIEYDSAR